MTLLTSLMNRTKTERCTVQTSVVNIKRSTAALAEPRLFFVALPPDVRKAYGFPDGFVS
jgi:hypothetical protein